MGAKRPRDLTFDAGALIALERGDERVRALLELAVRHGARLLVPAGVIGQVWRDGARQARLARFLRSPGVTIEPLGDEEARVCGVLGGRAKTRDVIAASVVVCARRASSVIVTSDVGDLRKLDPRATLVRI